MKDENHLTKDNNNFSTYAMFRDFYHLINVYKKYI